MKHRALLALPGWDDDGRQQFDALDQELTPAGWICRRAHIPDASWPARERERVSRAQSLQLVREDYMDLGAVRGVARSRLALLGFSFGAYLASFLVEARPPRLLVLRSPALYPDDGWSTPKEDLDKRALRAYRARVWTPEDNRSLWCCSRFRGDVLLIASGQDEVIPPPVIESYARSFRHARTLTRCTLPEADHTLSDPAWQRAYHALAVDWLNARLAP
ncbi:MAG TPA: alpha/beta hydrolase [Pseudorhodoferax sp.]|nr:alpha/beta hydrolase [Pseudorhodoferax sp.]